MGIINVVTNTSSSFTEQKKDFGEISEALEYTVILLITR